MLVTLYIVFFVVVTGGSCAVFVARIRVKRKQDALPPHDRWPEILDWRKGDYFSTKGWRYNRIQLICVHAGGFVLCDTDSSDKPLQSWRVGQLIGTNISLHQRTRKRWVMESSAYMETLDQVNESKLEIQARDRLNGIPV